jgi:hypothetical protein
MHRRCTAAGETTTAWHSCGDAAAHATSQPLPLRERGAGGPPRVCGDPVRSDTWLGMLIQQHEQRARLPEGSWRKSSAWGPHCRI